MKYNLETLSNEKFLINLLFDIILAFKIALKKYWYLFVVINVVAIYAANYHYSLQSKVFFLRSTIRLGSILTPSFGSGIISLPNVAARNRFGRLIIKENFGLNQKDFMSNVQRYLGGTGFMEKTTGNSFNYLSAFEYSTTSSYVSITGEGTDRKELIVKFEDLMGFILDLYEENKKIRNDPLLRRRDLLIEEKKIIDKEYADLLLIEKDFGFTSEVESKKDDLTKRLLDVKKQLLDFERSQKEPFLEEIKIVNLNVSKNARNSYGRKTFYLIYLGIGILTQAVLLVILILVSFRSLPPNIYFIDLEVEKI